MMHRFVWVLCVTLVLAVVPAGAQPLPAQPVNVSDTVEESTAPAIAATAEDDLYVAWQEGEEQINVAAQEDASWAAAPVAVGQSPAMAVGPSDVRHLVYIADDGTGNLEVYHTASEAGEWSVPLNVSLTSGTSASVDIAVAGDGTPHFLWVDATPGEPTLYHGTPVGAAPVLNAEGGAPAIALAANDEAHFVWQEPDDDTALGEVYYMRSSDFFAVNLSDSAAVESGMPDITVTPDGMAHVAWIEGGVVRARTGVPAAFSPATTISGAATDAASVKLASDAAGNVFGAWTESASRITAAVRWVETSEWQVPETIVEGLAGLEGISLVAGSDDVVHFAWSSYRPDSAVRDIYVKTSVFAAPPQNRVYLPFIARSE